MSEDANLTSRDAQMDSIAQLLAGGDDQTEQDVETPEDDDLLIEDPQSAVDDQDSDGDDAEPEEVEADGEGDDDQLAALAEELGLRNDQLSLDDEGALQVRLKINGKEELVPLKDAVNATQYEKATAQRSAELGQERKAFQEERQRVEQALQQQAMQVQGLTQALENKFFEDYSRVDWQQLRSTDPAEWAAKQKEFELRHQEVQAYKQQAGQLTQQHQQQLTQQEQQQQQEYLQEQRQIMLDRNPKWADPEIFKSDVSQLTQGVLKEYGGLGATEDELSTIASAWHVEVLKDAMAYRQGKQVAEKKVTNIPKLQRSSNGRFVGKKQSKIDKLVAKAKSAKGANKRHAQTEAVAALLLGDS